MDGDQGTVTTATPSVQYKQRPPPSWVPYAGSKRKAHIAGLGDNFDVDCRPSPAKQFAVDEVVASDILRDGFYFDPSIPAPPDENQIPEEVEMGDEQCVGVFEKGPGDITHTASARSFESMSEKVTVDERECEDDSVIKLHSMHESQPGSPPKHVSSKAQSLVMKGLSLILSNEIQETLTRRKLNEDFILPKSIMDRVSGTNTSMALVPWKPPMTMETLISQSIQNEKVVNNPPNPEPAFSNPPTPMSISQQTSIQPSESLLFRAIEDEGESMDVDIEL